MTLNAKLVVVGGDVKTSEITLRLPSTVGRGRGTTIVLSHPLVSRQHCELYEDNGQLMVRDLGSLNGTFVNNQRITESPLPSGELLTIGTVTFRALYDAPAGSLAAETAAPKAGAGLDATVKQPAAEPDEELSFDEPAEPVDEDMLPPPAGAMQATRRLETTLEDQPPGSKTKSAAGAKTAPAPAKAPPPAKPAAPQPAAADKGEPTVNFSKWQEEDDDEPMKVDEDDDLGDFLKNLGKK